MLFFGLAFATHAQDDKKTPEKKLHSGHTNVKYDPAKKPERKLIQKSEVNREKSGQVNGVPEKKLVDKK